MALLEANGGMLATDPRFIAVKQASRINKGQLNYVLDYNFSAWLLLSAEDRGIIINGHPLVPHRRTSQGKLKKKRSGGKMTYRRH